MSNNSTATIDVDSVCNTNAVLLQGTYSWSNSPSANAWTTIGTTLANYRVSGNADNTNVTSYTIQTSKDKSVRPYYRLKIFIDKIKGGNDILNIDINARKEEKTHYNSLLTSNILDEEKTADAMQNKNWKQTRLVQLYKIAVEKNKQMMDKYKAGEKVYFDAGVDLFCPAYYVFESFNATAKKLDHCVKCSMDKVETDKEGVETSNPVGYYLYPRSSTGTKTPLSLTNSVGIIDSGYRGNIIAAFNCARAHKYTATLYQRLVQLCPPDISYPIEIVLVQDEQDLGVSERGAGGFGSTGS